jgi:chitin disaccharide deacetylase
MSDSTRRAFLKSVGQETLLLAGLGIGVPTMTLFDAKDAYAAENGRKKMKLIMRGDDVGYSEVTNIGTFKAIDKGVVTSADVMFDTPGTLDALERLSKRPWISIGWHGHCWGKPVLGPDKVPSLIDKDGHFKWSMRDGTALVGDGLSKRDELVKLANEVNYDEAVVEFRAQMLLCVKILGRAPDTGGGGSDSMVGKAMSQVAKEFGLKSGWFTRGGGTMVYGTRTLTAQTTPCAPEYKHLNIYMPMQSSTTKYMLEPPGKFEAEKYNPMVGLRSDGDGILDKEIVQLAFHPGFIDDYIATDGGIQFNMNRVRVLDVVFLCSQELLEWIKEKKIELINQRDALYGTCEYQNHLRDIGSDLYMRG